MPTTPYHAKYFAHELTKRSPSGDIERFTAALMDSQVDLNPHQVDAALFAFRSPLSKGAILADEVGLGKTIEAGIVLSQKWAEGKRKILIILPSSLRKQWNQELMDKFYLPSKVLESTAFNKEIKKGVTNPFDREEIVLCSYPFARNKAKFMSDIPWDLVVIDEAHRLRNVYKPQNKIANAIRDALKSAPKLLLTATPLQNSLLELYGLVSFIDENTFGDLTSFKAQFARLTPGDNFDDLKTRLNMVCKRTLRRQVLEYITYTHRKAHTQEFVPSDAEQKLYDMVSDYLQRDSLNALPSSQRILMTLILRKLLASSTFAIAGALNSLANKLEKQLKEDATRAEAASQADAETGEDANDTDSIQTDFETFDQLVDEFMEGDEDEEDPPLTAEQRTAINHEIGELRDFYEQAVNITENAKGLALLSGLKIGFKMTTDLGGPEKAIIFTESRKTQDYLVQLLTDNGFADQIVLFNGSNNDAKSKEIYADWKAIHGGTDKATGSRAADIRAALVDYFRDSAKIMIATEAASEGINLQFCSMVVNYDLPWNPQRIEQRIGRCHRYGQKHDVVVVNFLNKNNAADQRVYELLSEKFSLFDGVFGASDEVLGTIESGVDFEKRIAEIYQTCRTTKEIQGTFDFLQEEMSEKISENLQDARTKLLENFDAEVAEKLNVFKEKSTESVNRYEALLWDVTQFMLGDNATFDEEQLTFELHQHKPDAQASEPIPLGQYSLKRRDDIPHHYRIHHPLATALVNEAADQELSTDGAAEVQFDYTNANRKVSILEPLIGQSGTMLARKVSITSLETEDHIIVAAMTADGETLTSDQALRLFNLPGKVVNVAEASSRRSNAETATGSDNIEETYTQLRQEIITDIADRNGKFFDEEMDKLDRWASDKRTSQREKLKEYDVQIADMKKESRTARNLQEKIEIRKKVRKLEAKREEAWKDYDVASKDIENQKDTLIDKVEDRLQQGTNETTLFKIQWSLT